MKLPFPNLKDDDGSNSKKRIRLVGTLMTNESANLSSWTSSLRFVASLIKWEVIIVPPSLMKEIRRLARVKGVGLAHKNVSY